jgi:phosphocarrier protein HPr
MIRRTIEVENELGLHARAAAKLVRLTSSFISEVKLSRAGAGHSIDAKSILGILLLAAKKGTRLDFVFDGPDEEVAASYVESLFQNRFGEEQ